MKKFLSFIFVFALVLQLPFAMLAQSEKEPLRITATTFPQYDWVREILGEDLKNVELTLLINQGHDLHNFQPSAADIARIADSDLFIYVGGESGAWVDATIKAANNPDLVSFSLMQHVETKPEEHVEGMQEDEHHHHEEGEEAHEHEHEHEHENGEEAHEHEHGELDEHVWLSLRHAQTLVKALSDTLSQMRPEMSSLYQTNADKYIKQLSDLDEQYKDAVLMAKNKTLLFADRFPFRYLADDYSLNYYAAFAGCSAETEASFQTIAFLSKKLDELQLPAGGISLSVVLEARIG